MNETNNNFDCLNISSASKFESILVLVLFGLVPGGRLLSKKATSVTLKNRIAGLNENEKKRQSKKDEKEMLSTL